MRIVTPYRTRSTIIVPASLVLGIQLLACCVPTGAPPGPAAPAAWTDFTHEAGRFRVQFPATPSHSTSADGLEHRYSATTDAGERLFRVSYEHGADTTFPLLDRMRGAFDELEATSTRLSLFETSIGEAVECEYDMTDDGELFHLRERVYYVGDTMYSVMVVATPARFDAAEADRFLNSFEVLESRMDEGLSP